MKKVGKGIRYKRMKASIKGKKETERKEKRRKVRHQTFLKKVYEEKKLKNFIADLKKNNTFIKGAPTEEQKEAILKSLEGNWVPKDAVLPAEDAVTGVV